MRPKKILVTAVLLFVSSTLASANLIQNGSFEDPVLPTNSFSSNVNVTSWSNPLAIFNGALGTPWPTAFDGDQFADISNLAGPGHSQTFTVVTGGSYLLSWAANTGYYGTETSATSPYLVTISGGVFSQSYDAFNFGVWQVNSQSLLLAAGNYTLTFAPQGAFGGYDTLIDAVSLTENSVPDHTNSAFALSGAFILMALARRWRRNQRDGGMR